MLDLISSKEIEKQGLQIKALEERIKALERHETNAHELTASFINQFTELRTRIAKLEPDLP